MNYEQSCSGAENEFYPEKMLLLHALSYFMLHDTYRDVLIPGLDFALGRAVTGG